MKIVKQWVGLAGYNLKGACREVGGTSTQERNIAANVVPKSGYEALGAARGQLGGGDHDAPRLLNGR